MHDIAASEADGIFLGFPCGVFFGLPGWIHDVQRLSCAALSGSAAICNANQIIASFGSIADCSRFQISVDYS
jgi:hypothetical protein